MDDTIQHFTITIGVVTTSDPHITLNCPEYWQRWIGAALSPERTPHTSAKLASFHVVENKPRRVKKKKE